jgi:hypothetical protein
MRSERWPGRMSVWTHIDEDVASTEDGKDHSSPLRRTTPSRYPCAAACRSVGTGGRDQADSPAIPRSSYQGLRSGTFRETGTRCVFQPAVAGRFRCSDRPNRLLRLHRWAGALPTASRWNGQRFVFSGSAPVHGHRDRQRGYRYSRAAVDLAGVTPVDRFLPCEVSRGERSSGTPWGSHPGPGGNGGGGWRKCPCRRWRRSAQRRRPCARAVPVPG